MTTSDQVELFASLFRGRSNAYARYWEKDGRSGYSPAYSFNWNEFMMHKRTGGTIRTFENKALIPLTTDVLRKHLEGQILAGVYPILPDSTSYFLAADFDGEQWFEDAQAYVKEAATVGLDAYLEKSKSGNGAHAWIFFYEPYPCYKSRRIGLEIVRRALTLSAFDKEPSFDRLFPNQDSVPTDGFGNLIALPLQGKYAREGAMIFIDSKNGAPISDQWAYLARVHKYDSLTLDVALAQLEGTSVTITPKSNLHKGKLAVHVGSKIELNRAQLTSKVTHFLKDSLNFLSAEYLTRKRLGKSVYGIEKYFKLVEEIGDGVFLPRGFLKQLLGFLDTEGISYDVVHEHPNFDKHVFSNSIVLSAPQAIVVEKIFECDQGVIVAPPGSGKTIIGLDIIAKRGLPALVLVHRKELLEQWVERIQTFLNIPKSKIGRFHGIKKKLGTDITVGLIQSFARTTDKSIFNSKFGTIVVDECHHIPASTFRKAIASLNPRYLYGLTATPKRKNNDEKIIYAYIGDVVATLTQSEKIAVETSGSTSTTLKIRIHETDLEFHSNGKRTAFNFSQK